MAYIRVGPYTAIGSPSPSRAIAKLLDGVDEFPTALQRLAALLPSIPSTIHALSHPSDAIIPVPITPEAFAPYGQLIWTYPDRSTRPENLDIVVSPDGKIEKLSRLANVLDSYQEASGAVTGIGVFRATPKVGLERGKVFDVRYMERHPYTTQAFIPMGKAEVGRLGRVLVRAHTVLVEGHGRGSFSARRRIPCHRREKRTRFERSLLVSTAQG